MNYATPIKTIDQAKAFIEALNAFEWGEFDCPIGYALHVMGE